MERHMISYYIGIAIVFASHAYILFKPSPLMTMEQHSYLNLVAVLLIAYYFMFTNKYIEF